jgi:hypothetical protein
LRELHDSNEARLVSYSGHIQGQRMGQRMNGYSWTCACGITIWTDTEKQMDMKKKRHYNIHAKAAGWDGAK